MTNRESRRFAIAVRWRFPQGELSLALNIAEQTQTLPQMAGKTLFAWPQESGELPQHSIIVRLAQGAAQ